MMGASSKVKRNELLRMKATGDEREISAWIQKNLFDKGHELEALARPIAEEIIGQELYPATATDDDGFLLASFDGITMLEDISWEHKMWNEQLAEQVRGGELGPEYYWQLEQQLAVSGAEQVIFMCSDGTRDRCVWMCYEPVPGRREQLLAAWKQFEEDLANYQPEEVQPEVVGRAPDTLPALRIEVTGMVTQSNLIEFRRHAHRAIAAINTELNTDQDFANAEKTVKWCSGVESRLKAAKDHALSQTSTIDELFRTLDAISEEARTKRLELNKLVKARKQQIRDEILMSAAGTMTKHIEAINKSWRGMVRMPSISTDFSGAMKGKKTVASLKDAADTELARAKIEANQLAEKISGNVAILEQEVEPGLESLFPDVQQLALKEADDLRNLIKLRISEHLEAEKKRQAQQAELQPQVAPEAPTITETWGTGNQPEPVRLGRSSNKAVDRPTSSQIIWLLAVNYKVSTAVVIDWLQQIDFEKLRKSLCG